MINNIIVKKSNKLIKERRKKILVLTTLLLFCSSFGAGSREVSKMRNSLRETPKSVRSSKKKHDIVTATFYNPEKRQCDSDPLITADNSEICLKKLKKKKIRWIAVSRDLLDRYSFGDIVRISGDSDIAGIYEVHDTMNKRYIKRIDILTLEKLEKGVWKNIKIEKVS